MNKTEGSLKKRVLRIPRKCLAKEVKRLSPGTWKIKVQGWERVGKRRRRKDRIRANLITTRDDHSNGLTIKAEEKEEKGQKAEEKGQQTCVNYNAADQKWCHCGMMCEKTACHEITVMPHRERMASSVFLHSTSKVAVRWARGHTRERQQRRSQRWG